MFGKKTASLQYISTYFSTYFHSYKKKIISRIFEEIHSSRMSSKGFSLRHLPNLFHRGRNEHYYILLRDHKQSNQHKTWHMQRDPNIKAAPSVFMAKHLEYFRMEIQGCPLENVDERILAGNQSAYQIDGAAGSCCRNQIWNDLIGSGGSALGWGKKGNDWWPDGHRDRKWQRYTAKWVFKNNFKKVMNYCDQEGNWFQVWIKSCGRQSKKLI